MLPQRVVGINFDQMDLNYYALLERLAIPIRTLWTNELLLKMNPNDIILRSEILGWCNKGMLGGCMHLQDLEVSALYTTHVLWLLENVPHADLHFFTRAMQENSSYAKVVKKRGVPASKKAWKICCEVSGGVSSEKEVK
jgi:hypothetical protein